MIQTQFQLATVKKGFESITEYFHKAQALSASLSAAEHPLPSSQSIVYLLASLGMDLELVVTSITTRPKPLTTYQIFIYLLNHEALLAHQHQSLLSITPISANVATRAPMAN